MVLVAFHHAHGTVLVMVGQERAVLKLAVGSKAEFIEYFAQFGDKSSIMFALRYFQQFAGKAEIKGILQGAVLYKRNHTVCVRLPDFAYQEYIRIDLFHSCAEFLPPGRVLVRDLRGVHRIEVVAIDVAGCVKTEAIHALFQPELAGIDHFLMYRRIIIVQVRHSAAEQAQIAVTRGCSPLLPYAFIARMCVVRRVVVFIFVVVRALLNLEIVAVRARLRIGNCIPEPRVATAAMVYHQIHNDFDPMRMRFIQHILKVFHRAIVLLHAVVVYRIVTVVAARLGNWHQPNSRDTQILQIIHLAGQAVKVTDAIPVGIAECADKDLIEIVRRLFIDEAGRDFLPVGIHGDALCHRGIDIEQAALSIRLRIPALKRIARLRRILRQEHGASCGGPNGGQCRTALGIKCYHNLVLFSKNYGAIRGDGQCRSFQLGFRVNTKLSQDLVKRTKGFVCFHFNRHSFAGQVGRHQHTLILCHTDVGSYTVIAGVIFCHVAVFQRAELIAPAQQLFVVVQHGIRIVNLCFYRGFAAQAVLIFTIQPVGQALALVALIPRHGLADVLVRLHALQANFFTVIDEGVARQRQIEGSCRLRMVLVAFHHAHGTVLVMVGQERAVLKLAVGSKAEFIEYFAQFGDKSSIMFALRYFQQFAGKAEIKGILQGAVLYKRNHTVCVRLPDFAYQEYIRIDLFHSCAEFLPPGRVLVRDLRGVHRIEVVAIDVAGCVKTEAIHALFQPELAGIDHFLMYRRIIIVQVRHSAAEQAQIAVTRGCSPLLPYAFIARMCVVRRVVVFIFVVVRALLNLEIVAVRARLRIGNCIPEPRVATAAMVYHQIHNDFDPMRMRFIQHILKVFHRAIVLLHAVVVYRIVTVVAARLGNWHQPNSRDTQILQIIHLAGQAVKVTDAIPVGIAECADKDLIEIVRRLFIDEAGRDFLPVGIHGDALCHRGIDIEQAAFSVRLRIPALKRITGLRWILRQQDCASRGGLDWGQLGPPL